ncbi:hypothetical protein BGZ76_010664, partial [Entomortierella beljakovae]
IARGIWLATWSSREYPEPASHDVDELRQFMRAKYVKKLWYQDANGGSSVPPGSTDSSSNGVKSNAGLFVPGQTLNASNKSKSIDNLTAQFASTAPEQTLSRKSSSISSDSGSTTISKSTNPSSTGSSPFNPAGSKSTSHLQFQQSQQSQQSQQNQQLYQSSLPLQQAQQLQTQPSFDDFAGLMNNGKDNFGSNTQSTINTATSSIPTSIATTASIATINHNYAAVNPSILGSQAFSSTPAATDNDADPFSLMTNAFNNMGMNNSHSTITSTADTYSSNHYQYGNNNNIGNNGNNMFSQNPAMSPSKEFFATFSSGPTSSATIQATTGITAGDPFSLGSSYFQQQSRSMTQPISQPHQSSQLGSLQGLDFSLSSAPQVNNTTSTEELQATKSFDDYLSILGNGRPPQSPQAPNLSSQNNLQSFPSSPLAFPSSPSAFPSSTTSLSPQATGVSNPFGLQAQPAQQFQQSPHTIQRSFTSDSAYQNPASSNSGGGQANPFAMFAKSQSSPSQNQPALSDPFGRHQQVQQQQQGDYFTMPGLNTPTARSPNPFMMSQGQAVHSPFEQKLQESNPSPFIRSQSDPSSGFQNPYFGNNGNNSINNNNNNVNANYSNLGGAATGVNSNNGFESAFSVPAAPIRSMTTPMNQSNGIGSNNDMFSQWVKPSPLGANLKYPSIDDLDPFSTSTAGAAAPAMSNPAFSTPNNSNYSNPFSLNM